MISDNDIMQSLHNLLPPEVIHSINEYYKCYICDSISSDLITYLNYNICKTCKITCISEKMLPTELKSNPYADYKPICTDCGKCDSCDQLALAQLYKYECNNCYHDKYTCYSKSSNIKIMGCGEYRYVCYDCFELNTDAAVSEIYTKINNKDECYFH
jgi:hypothetical protein